MDEQQALNVLRSHLHEDVQVWHHLLTRKLGTLAVVAIPDSLLSQAHIAHFATTIVTLAYVDITALQ